MAVVSPPEIARHKTCRELWQALVIQLLEGRFCWMAWRGCLLPDCLSQARGWHCHLRLPQPRAAQAWGEGWSHQLCCCFLHWASARQEDSQEVQPWLCVRGKHQPTSTWTTPTKWEGECERERERDLKLSFTWTVHKCCTCEKTFSFIWSSQKLIKSVHTPEHDGIFPHYVGTLQSNWTVHAQFVSVFLIFLPILWSEFSLWEDKRFSVRNYVTPCFPLRWFTKMFLLKRYFGHFVQELTDNCKC